MPLPRLLQPRKVPRQERSRALVDACLDAAAELLVTRGWENLQMAEVAERAGASVGSLYQYFPHKEALVAALLERHSQAEAAYLEERFASLPDLPLPGLLEAMVRAVLAFRGQHPELHRALLEVIPVIGRHAELRNRGARTTAVLRDLLEQAHRPEPGQPSVDEVVFVLANATHALTHEGLLPRPATLDDARLAGEVTRLLLGYLAALPGLRPR